MTTKLSLKTSAGLLFFALILFSFPTFVNAQQTVGTITGKIHDILPQVESGIVIQLVETTTHSILQETSPGKAGEFTFRNVPFATYDVEIKYDGELAALKRVNINSAVPIALEFSSLNEYKTKEVIITAEQSSLARSLNGSHTFFTSSTIKAMPVAMSNKQIESVLLNTPGVVPDEDGRLHVRGEDAQIQYVVDGIPITSNMTRVYSSLFNAHLIKGANIETGNLDAQYGVATSAVLAITTKSGFEKPFFADASATYGSFDSKDASLQLGGNVAEKNALYFGFNATSSDRYLDPITDGPPNHDYGNSYDSFGKFTTLLGSNTSLDVLGSYNTTKYDIPNLLNRTPAQDQVQNLDDYLIGARLSSSLSENSFLTVAAYRHQTHAKLTSGGLIELNSPSEYATAIQENEKFFIGSDRLNTTTGAQVEYSTVQNWFGIRHDFKAGLSGAVYPIHEFFTFAVTNPALSDSTTPGGDPRYLPYDITKGGQPFLVDQSRTADRYAGYLQDEFTVDRWLFDIGLRYDQFNLLIKETGFSPRIAVAYKASDRLVFRASYNRIIMQAPLENILVSSSEQARVLTGAQQGNVPTVVQSEREHAAELGATYKLNSYFDFDLTGYGKLIDNFLVNAELGNSGIIFPINLKNGFVAGGEALVRLNDWNRFSGNLSVSTCVSRGETPSDGSSPIAAGLIFGEEGQNYSHPFAGETTFPTEHDQLLTVVLNLTYTSPSGFFAGLNGRFDSGLPFDLVGPDGRGVDAAQAKVLLEQRGYTDGVINLLSLSSDQPGSPDKSVAPHTVFDAVVGYNFAGVLRLPVTLSASILNVFNTPFLYRFESTFGGTHFGYPRMMNVKLAVNY